MDIELQRRISDTIGYLRELAIEDIDFNQMDPIAKMMLVALLNEVQKIQDDIESISRKVVERYCTHFIPRENVEAMPAIALLRLAFKPKKDVGCITVGSGVFFSYKSDIRKQPLNYVPIFKTSIFPYSDIFSLTHSRMSFGNESRVIKMDKPNRVWVGIVNKVEVECIQGLSLLVKGTHRITPEHIYIGIDNREVEFATMRDMENIGMAEPFDAQQSSSQFFSILGQWKECLLNMEDASLIYVTDGIHDRDLFKSRSYPRVFQQWLEDETLDCFDANTLWLQLDFPEGYSVPETCEVLLNVVPVTNVDVNSLTLTQASPIAKLQKQDDSFFLKVLETSSSAHKQGFGMNSEEIIIRDFDADCYNNGDLYRDVRNLYNKFIDDYYAFIEYNGIKDGEVLKQLRETINRLGKSVGDKSSKYQFDSGTYVMKNMNQYPPTSSTKVSYLTTQGRAGNAPKAGEQMENKKLPSIEQKVSIVVSATGGSDKISADERYEQLRYFSLTNDRLYTKMDIDAFLRKEIMAEFGREEFRRIFIKINIEGAGGSQSLVRGLYIDIEFKDKKNYEKAVSMSFDKIMEQKIENKSCITMPIIVELKNLDCQE